MASAHQGEEKLPWPVGAAAVFAYPTAFETILAYDHKGDEPLFNYGLELHGFGRLDANGALLLGNGTASAPLQDKGLIEQLAAAGQPNFTLEAWLTFPATTPKEEVEIVSYADGNFVLSQNGDQLRFRVGGGPLLSFPTPSSAEEPLASMTRHLCVCVQGKGATLYLDGKPRSEGQAKGAGDGWISGPLVFGSGKPETIGWNGKLEGFALHTQALSAGQVSASARAYAQRAKQRKAPRVTRLQAKLLTRSRVPTVEEIAPYPESIAVYEYEVVKVMEGFYLPKKMRVAHWIILGEKPLANGAAKVGETYELAVIDFARNRQLENVNISDTLEFDFDLRLFFDIGTPLLAPEK